MRIGQPGLAALLYSRLGATAALVQLGSLCPPCRALLLGQLLPLCLQCSLPVCSCGALALFLFLLLLPPEGALLLFGPRLAVASVLEWSGVCRVGRCIVRRG